MRELEGMIAKLNGSLVLSYNCSKEWAGVLTLEDSIYFSTGTELLKVIEDLKEDARNG